MAIRRGRPDKPVGLTYDDQIVRLNGCPDCQGRGWFLINPFATGGGNGCGGIANLCQCLTCLDSKSYWDAHGELPPEIRPLLPPEIRDVRKSEVTA
jgi:hypothetical protein